MKHTHTHTHTHTLYDWQHFVRRGDYRLIIRDSEPIRARDFV